MVFQKGFHKVPAETVDLARKTNWEGFEATDRTVNWLDRFKRVDLEKFCYEGTEEIFKDAKNQYPPLDEIIDRGKFRNLKGLSVTKLTRLLEGTDRIPGLRYSQQGGWVDLASLTGNQLKDLSDLMLLDEVFDAKHPHLWYQAFLLRLPDLDDRIDYTLGALYFNQEIIKRNFAVNEVLFIFSCLGFLPKSLHEVLSTLKLQ